MRRQDDYDEDEGVDFVQVLTELFTGGGEVPRDMTPRELKEAMAKDAQFNAEVRRLAIERGPQGFCFGNYGMMH